MSLRFIYGRAGSGKSRFCLEEIKSAIEQKSERSLVLIVPEQYSFQAERDLIAIVQSGGILKTDVLSFKRLSFRVFNDAGGITWPHLNTAGKGMILHHILAKKRDQLKLFAKSSERDGFIDTLSKLITEFKRYNVTPSHLEKASGEMDEGHTLSIKLKELALLYMEFENTIKARYRDSDDDLTLAAKKLAETTLFEGADIWLDGFASFTPQEYAIIAQLIKKANRLTVSVCTDSLALESNHELDIFSNTKNACKKLMRMAEDDKVAVEKAVHLNTEPLMRFRESPELAHLERNYFAYPHQAYALKTQAISLFSATSPFTEVEAVARKIISLLRDQNLRYRDIAVVTRNLAGYDKLVEVIFAEYGIPCFIDRKVEISNHPLVRLLVSMMDIFNENWSYEAVFGYLKTGLTGVFQPDIDKLENYVLACGIRGSKWTQDKEWQMSPDLLVSESKMDQEYLKNINQIRWTVCNPLMDFRAKTKGRRTAREFCAGLYDYLCELGVTESIEISIDRFKESGQLVLANLYSQVWNIVMEVFDQIAEVLGDETMGLERFSDLLKTGLSQYQIGLIPASLDQVLVGSVDRSKSHEVKVLFLLGVNDGVFPSASYKEGILTDQDRSALSNLGLELASDTRAQAFDEQFLVYRALTASGKALRISWPIADHEGKTMRPSLIALRLRKLFPLITESSNILPPHSDEEALEFVASKGSAFKQMVSLLRQKADGKSIHAVWPGVWQWFETHAEWDTRLKELRQSFLYKNLAEPVSETHVSALYGDPAISSISRLEKYSACPFAYYIQYGLGAKERKVYKLTPPDIGTFMHAVIERFSKTVSNGEVTWRNMDRTWCSSKVSQIIDDLLKSMQGSGLAASTRYVALAARLKRVVTRAVWLIAEHIRRSSFDPVAYEVGFGENEAYPPIVIELDSGKKIQLKGRIDRVDALKTETGSYLRIVDYKSGTKDFNLSDVYYGLQIQLVTYLDAIWESESNRGQFVLPAGMLYFKIDDPIIKGNNRMSEEEIELAIMKQLKMRGLLLADVKLIREMDKSIEGASLILPATVNKGDVLGKSSSTASKEQFKALRSHIRKLLKDLCTEIMKGKVDVKPFKKKGATACSYCSFLPVCQFDTTNGDNNFKLLHDKDNHEIWALMGQADE